MTFDASLGCQLLLQEQHASGQPECGFRLRTSGDSACLSVGAQRAIADYLDTETGRIDALITKKRRMIELLEERRSHYVSEAGVSVVSWFTTAPSCQVIRVTTGFSSDSPARGEISRLRLRRDACSADHRHTTQVAANPSG